MADYLVDLEENEHVVLEVRKHIFLFSLEVLLIGILVLVPLLVFVSTANTLTEMIGRGGTLATIAYLLWVLIMWIAFFFRWTDYYLDVWVITNKRVFDIEQKGMFNRTTSVFRLERIEDITIEVNGILATMLKYGDIHIHTAGTHDPGRQDSDLTIKGARHPLEVKRVIMEECGKVMQDSGVRVRHNTGV